MLGLHAVGNHIETADGTVVSLRGVNRSGTEYKCVQSQTTIFDGPFDEPSIQAMVAWKINAVRIPLNEACWLATNGATAPTVTGPAYKAAIVAYVALLHKYNLVPIVELHWVGPGTSAADRQQPMPDANSVLFWADVAQTFAGDLGVVFDLYNEPFPSGNADSDAAWTCWRDGCTTRQSVPSGGTAMMYDAVGMQRLVQAVRVDGGATNLILLGGVQYSNALTQFLKYMPVDTLSPPNIGASWHIYNFNACVTIDCWSQAPAAVAALVPLVATEIGENDCMTGPYLTALMQWLDGNGDGYLAWSWNAFGACTPAPPMTQGGRPWSLITDYVTGAPNGGFAQGFHDHVSEVAGF
jgi:hypothetical protein